IGQRLHRANHTATSGPTSLVTHVQDPNRIFAVLSAFASPETCFTQNIQFAEQSQSIVVSTPNSILSSYKRSLLAPTNAAGAH
ncbi:hypothetical protein KCU82_g11533, partial [Aureobasidium melanogenum]